MKPVIIGSGLAGLTTALALAPMPVILLSSKKLGEESSSAWAQGGIAAAVGEDDTPALHAADTLAAGAGLCDADIARSVAEDGPAVIEWLAGQGVPFDRDAAGRLLLGLEAAHSRRRIVHIADGTGASIVAVLSRAVRATPSIEMIENATAQRLLVKDNQITGVVVRRDDATAVLPTNQIVLATGGAGALWRETSNPLGSWGQGLWLAAEAGAALRDLEFMQFHPTAIDIGRDPMPLASEALRGEGCILINEKGERFIDELQPRDIVARAIGAQRAAGQRVFLDARTALGAHFTKRFPTVAALCQSAGIDPATMPIPVAPAAHYHMGGVAVDRHGRSHVSGLWVCGETACTGLHGANRLASNSLLEAAVFGRRVAADIGGQVPARRGGHSETLAAQTGPASPASDQLRVRIRALMSRHVGLLRHADGLQQACKELAEGGGSPMASVALLIARAALRREESRGSHTRTDFPALSGQGRHHQTLLLSDIRN